MNNKNTGFAILNGDAANLTHKTVLVLGVGRGGTSMTAGVLSKLGIYMGDQLSSRYQDQSLLDCIHRRDKKQAQKIIQERNEKYAVWGVKKLDLWRWNNMFREPVYVFVFRDIFATANRRVTMFNVSLVSEMFKILGLNLLLLIFLRFSKRPILITSYEKALLYPDDFVKGLSLFLGLDDDQAKFAEAVQFITPSPSEYTSSPVNRGYKVKEYIGYIDKVEANKVAGWGLSIVSPNPVEVELLVNGIYKQTITANLSRPDVVMTHNSACFRENCGFAFKFSGNNVLKSGDYIEVRIAEQHISLINSPRRFV